MKSGVGIGQRERTVDATSMRPSTETALVLHTGRRQVTADAVRIIIAVTDGVDYLVTWNLSISPMLRCALGLNGYADRQATSRQ